MMQHLELAQCPSTDARGEPLTPEGYKSDGSMTLPTQTRAKSLTS